VGDDRGIVVASGDAGHVLLTVARLEVILAGDERRAANRASGTPRPLIDKMIRHEEHGFLARPKRRSSIAAAIMLEVLPVVPVRA
jgi:hypothetical protein